MDATTIQNLANTIKEAMTEDGMDELIGLMQDLHEGYSLPDRFRRCLQKIGFDDGQLQAQLERLAMMDLFHTFITALEGAE